MQTHVTQVSDHVFTIYWKKKIKIEIICQDTDKVFYLTGNNLEYMLSIYHTI
jgi:hypothetical protein